MATYDIEQVLINEANRIGPDIYRKTLNTSPWLKLIKKDVWPDEMGDTIRVLTYERSLPANALSWNRISIDPVQADDGSFPNNTTVASGSGWGNNAVPSAQVINFAQTLRAYNLNQTALESPKLSVNDLRFSLKRKEQLSNIFAILQENTSYAWQDRYRDEFVRIAQNKINAAVSGGSVVAACGDGSQFRSDVLPSSILVQGLLDRAYMKLIRDGAGNNPLDRENARPVFGAVMSSEASRNLIAANPDIRQDYRWSSKVNELLAPLGIERSYAGFFHMVDDWGPRHDAIAFTANASATSTTISIADADALTLAVGGQLSGSGIAVGTLVASIGAAGSASSGSTAVVLSQGLTANVSSGAYFFARRLPYTQVATTQGYKWDISPLYEAAAYEDTIVFHQDVFTNLVPKPITAAGSNVTFDAVSYMGDFKWKNIITPDTNPDGTIGYFRAILASGSKPIRPEWGHVIRHLRASTPLILDGATNGSANILVQPVLSESSAATGQTVEAEA
jgi:hypothetical protein